MAPPPDRSGLPPSVLAALGLVFGACSGAKGTACLTVACLQFAETGTPTTDTARACLSVVGETGDPPTDSADSGGVTACLTAPGDSGTSTSDSGGTGGIPARAPTRREVLDRLAAEGRLPADVLERLTGR